MDQSFQLPDPQGAQAFLRRLPAEVQRRGHTRYHEGAVESLKVIKPASAYSAVVQDTAWKLDVSLRYDPAEGWDADCSCPVEFDCAHVFAAMSALLAEHREGHLGDGHRVGGFPVADRYGVLPYPCKPCPGRPVPAPCDGPRIGVPGRPPVTAAGDEPP